MRIVTLKHGVAKVSAVFTVVDSNEAGSTKHVVEIVVDFRELYGAVTATVQT